MGFLSKSNLFVLCCLCLNFGVAVDTIRSSQSIKDTDSDYIISNGSTFKLGFFSPVNSTNRYLGIWYNRISVFTVIWVENREKPLKDYSGVLTISEDGNLVVLNGQKEILWSSNVTNSVVNPRGFEQRNTEEWNRGNWSSGCVRRTPLKCERVNTTGGEDNKADGFLKLKMMKVLDFADYSSVLEDECRQKCLENYSCIAYAYDTGTACLSWTRSLIDAQKFSSGGVDLYMRVAFSEHEKLDVFGFGVLLLEIVSGRRITFYDDEQSLTLLGLAWKLWNVDNIVALIDSMVYAKWFEMEMLRCIHVGLLCVQEIAKDRPTASVVVSMLKSEIVDLPHPKKPAYTERQMD
uniref:Uncharacterized protein n=1 Tax=Quercus lobata TaxID=97700 RepID=A0A7N2LV46_QUELO